jgi:hypothetical protein
MTTQSASSGWWAKFTFNGITRYDQGAYDLVGGEELIAAEREELLQLCRQRLDAFRFSSMRTWVSNSRFSSDRARSSRVVRSWLPM